MDIATFPAGQTARERVAAILEAAGLELHHPAPFSNDRYREQVRQMCEQAHPAASGWWEVRAPMPDIPVLVPPPAIDFALILDSHIRALAAEGRTAAKLLISHTEAGRCGISDATEILGLQVVRTDTVPLGYARLELAPRSEWEIAMWEIALPLYFTED